MSVPEGFISSPQMWYKYDGEIESGPYGIDAAGVPYLLAGASASPALAGSFGLAGARFTSADASAAPAAITNMPGIGEKIVVTSVLLSAAAAMRVDLKEETSGMVVASIYLPINGTYNWVPVGKLKLVVANKRLMLQTSVAGTIAASAFYYSEA